VGIVSCFVLIRNKPLVTLDSPPFTGGGRGRVKFIRNHATNLEKEIILIKYYIFIKIKIK